MTFPLPSQLTCPRCGAVAFPTDSAIRASESNASVAQVAYKCTGIGCHQFVNYSPITGRIVER